MYQKHTVYLEIEFMCHLSSSKIFFLEMWPEKRSPSSSFTLQEVRLDSYNRKLLDNKCIYVGAENILEAWESLKMPGWINRYLIIKSSA